MEWYEEQFSELASWEEIPDRAKKICVLLVRGQLCKSKGLNDIFYDFQEKMADVSAADSDLLACIYGDKGVWIKKFEDQKGKAYYLSERAEEVNQAQLFIMADAWIRNQEDCKDIHLVIFRESEFGLTREESNWFQAYFEGNRSYLPYQVSLCDRYYLEDAVTAFVRSRNQAMYSWKEIDVLIEKLRG